MIRRWIEQRRLSRLEGRLARGGYRRLQTMQVREAAVSSKKALREVADVVLQLRAATEALEKTLTEMTTEEEEAREDGEE